MKTVNEKSFCTSSNFTNCSDSELVSLFLSGDRLAYNALFGRYRSDIVKAVKRDLRKFSSFQDLVNDCVHDIFVYLGDAILRGSYNANFPFKPWLSRVVWSQIGQFKRNEKNHGDALYLYDACYAEDADDNRRFDVADDSDFDEVCCRLNRKEYIYDHLMDAVDQLPRDLKDVFCARYFDYDTFSYKAYAKAKGIKESTAISRWKYAIDCLNRMLNGAVAA